MSTITDSKRNSEVNTSGIQSKAAPETSVEGREPTTNREWKQTYWYIGGALLFLAITGGLEWANRPAPIKEFGRVGEEFYTDFVDPTLATSLEVFAFDPDTVKPKEFRVERLDNGRWVIPSHHNYPADAEEQLARTASSVIGITRGAMVTRWEADHARYGVVNPKQDSLAVDQVDGVGQRLILRGDDDSVLADFIVGKQVDGNSDEYYVRHPEEDEVYIAKLDIDLTTKFTDWIDTDLFDINTGEVLQLTVNDYSFDELSGKVTQSDITSLTREKAWSDDWQLDSLDIGSEELDKDAIRDTLDTISNLEIAGVRQKQQGLTPDLQLDKTVLSSQRDVDRLQSDLLSRGFLLQPGKDEDALSLIAREGELYAGTDDGLVYRMHFGRVFTGSQEELEVGFATASEGNNSVSEGTEADSNDSSDSDITASETMPEEGADNSIDSKGKPGRYVFVRVDFDKSLLGEEPVKPTEPTKPAELVEAEADTSDADSGEETNANSTTEPSAESNDGEAASEDASAENTEDSPLEKLRKEYEDAKKKYDDDLKAYEDYQKNVSDGQEKAEELNRRFAEWYYVIPGESYDKLSLVRPNFVKAKEVETETDDADVSDEPTSDVDSSSSIDASTEDVVAKPDSSSLENAAPDESSDVSTDNVSVAAESEEPTESNVADGETEDGTGTSSD
jgi:hypothetical protein